MTDDRSVPVEFSDERDAAADRVDGEEVAHRRSDLAVVAVGPPQPVPHLAVGADVGVDRPHRDHLGTDGRVLGHPDGEVSRRADEFGRVVVEILK